MVLGIGLSGAIFTTYLALDTPEAFYKGIEKGFLLASAVSVLGILMSAIKKR